VIEPDSPQVRVYFDVTRLLSRGKSTPTGIDRVDLAYVKALASAPGFDLRLMTFDVFGPRLLRPRQAGSLIDAMTRRWQLASSPARVEPAFRRVLEWLQSPAGTMPRALESTAARSIFSDAVQPVYGALQNARDSLLPQRSPTPGRSPTCPAIYLNTSHGQLFRKAVSRWLRDARIGGVFFVHDLIPIEFPEFNRAREPARHTARLETVSAHARQVLVNSEATRSALERYLGERKLHVPPVSVLPLGVEQRFTQAEGLETVKPSIPYFVVLGTIEPRKNHQLLLQLWRRWIETEGPIIPRLVVVGRRGWENETVFNLLDRSPMLSGHVAECSDLSDQQVGALLRGARALLCPSFAEGYSLPVVEALALGTPVIASALPVHREVGGQCAEYLDPLDGGAWLRALKDYAGEPSPRRNERLKRLQDYRPPVWEAHFAQAITLMREAACKS
jgi:glycosyltransferase involved in cell wall biosynthesis